MAIRAVVFDIGGVLELTPGLGAREKWERVLGLKAGELDERLESVWRGGSVGSLSEEEVERSIGELTGMCAARVAEFMGDIWEEYLGTPNVELTEYFRGLRLKYRTALLSNSFVGARERERERERYGFEELCDLIVYSHEVGMEKPDPRIFELTCERLGVRPGRWFFSTTSRRTSRPRARTAFKEFCSKGTRGRSPLSKRACARTIEAGV